LSRFKFSVLAHQKSGWSCKHCYGKYNMIERRRQIWFNYYAIRLITKNKCVGHSHYHIIIVYMALTKLRCVKSINCRNVGLWPVSRWLYYRCSARSADWRAPRPHHRTRWTRRKHSSTWPVYRTGRGHSKPARWPLHRTRRTLPSDARTWWSPTGDR